MKRVLFAAAAAAALAAAEAEARQAAPAARPADAVPAQGVISYRPDFFAEARPETALDIVNRVPGFSVAGGASVRGYAGTAGNVLIDGERPITKADSITDILARVPASSVERIDLIRGGAPGIDMQGRPVVVNVIRRRGGELKQSVALSAMTFGDGRALPGVRYEVSRQTDPRRGFELVLERAGVFTDQWGDARRIRRNPLGEVTQDIGQRIEGDGFDDSARGSFKRPLAGGLLQVNGTLRHERFKDENDFLLPAGPDFTVGNGEALTGEVGLNYAYDLGKRTKLELLALQRLGEGSGSSASRVAGAGDSLFTSEDTSGESILRGRVVFARSPRLSLESGGEVAFNFLDGRTRFLVNGVERQLPSANVRVEELRGELFGVASWRPSEKLSLEAGSRFETSTISQSGDADQEKSFFYPKPRLFLSWSINPGLQLRLRFEREVGQLSFSDFIASAEFASDTVYAGNADLEPQTAWVSEAVGERRFWKRGVLAVRVTRRDLQNVIDFVPIAGGEFQAPGNIGEGTSEEAAFSLTLPTDELGLAGVTLRTSMAWRRSEVTDPVTGEQRRISRQRPFDATAGITHDVPRLKLTWTFDANAGWQETSYLVGELSRSELTHWWTTSVEYKPSPKWSFRAQLTDLDEYYRLRTFYAGLRGLTPVRLTEERIVPPPFRLQLRVRRTLG